MPKDLQTFSKNKIERFLQVLPWTMNLYVFIHARYTVPKAVWEIFLAGNFPSQHVDNTYSLLEDFYSAALHE